MFFILINFYPYLGVKLLDGPTTDMLEAEALNHALDLVDVYSNSWGPTDDGKTLEGPGKLTLMALEKGVKEVNNNLNKK